VARQRHLGEFDVAGHHVIDPLGAAQHVGFRQLDRQFAVDELLDLALDLVGELVAVGPNSLMPLSS
jgi:hypothetical protein